MASIIDDHPLIAGLGIAGERLEAEALVATVLLDLVGRVFTGTDQEIQKAAIATQVKFQVSEGFDATKFASVDRDRRSWEAQAGAQVGISPVAKRLAESLTVSAPSSSSTDVGYRVITALP